MELEKLFEKIITNVDKDRAVLEELNTHLSEMGESPLLEENPEARIATAELVTRVSDSLTRNNLQLVELAKIQAKREILNKAKDRPNSDDIYRELEGEGLTS